MFVRGVNTVAAAYDTLKMFALEKLTMTSKALNKKDRNYFNRDMHFLVYFSRTHLQRHVKTFQFSLATI